MTRRASASLTDFERPLSAGVCATIACLWEATAPKPGNVYRGADFEDLTYADFLVSAAAIGPILDTAVSRGIGATVLQAVQATRRVVATNTNLGILLLLAPLATVPAEESLAEGIAAVLAALSPEDTVQAYEAIRIAQPGGLGQVSTADVSSEAIPELSLQEAMRFAADRDLVARQYVSGFQQVFFAAGLVESDLKAGASLCDAIVRAYLTLLSQLPDSLIARKCGLELAEEVSVRAAAALASGPAGSCAFAGACQELDFWLRSDGHRRNPGTTADLIAAGLFVLLREQRLNWPVDFYAPEK
ncbi:MAG: triphosphoribosyl-dephospho-CoA synthase [Planctomycetales bacterium]|nr:triphosphoribosyl-dephospho-CoA synthase [Planctomycetales bacterium]